MGRIRDLERNLPEDNIQGLITQNTTLKRRVQELSRESDAFRERLQAARSNNQSLDVRIADLEAELLEKGGARGGVRHGKNR
jgi:chromosome segregation ATPase